MKAFQFCFLFYFDKNATLLLSQNSSIMKKINFVLLFVAIVSSNAFGHDTTFVTYGTQICKIDSISNFYGKSKIFPEMHMVTVTNDYIEILNVGKQYDDTLYTIIESCGEMKTDKGEKAEYFKCKDSERKICYIAIMKNNYEHENARVEIQYSNVAILYFLQ